MNECGDGDVRVGSEYACMSLHPRGRAVSDWVRLADHKTRR